MERYSVWLLAYRYYFRKLSTPHFNLPKKKKLSLNKKKISRARAEQIAHSLYSAARLSYSAVDDDSPVYLQVKHLVNQIQEETKLKASIIEQMTALAKELPEYNELLSIPGLGVRTVVSLIGELGDIRRFRNSNVLNAFIGIDLRHYESGDYVANDHISKRGNTVARKILFKAIQIINYTAISLIVLKPVQNWTIVFQLTTKIPNWSWLTLIF